MATLPDPNRMRIEKVFIYEYKGRHQDAAGIGQA